MPLTKDEYLKASRGLATGFGATVDFADPQVGGTSQSAEGIGDAYEGLPGQVFSVDQLPDPAIAVAYGMPPQTIPEHLILDSAEEAENHIQGKTVEDIANAQLRRDLNDPVLTFDNQIASAEESLMSLGERTGANAHVLQDAVAAEDEKEDGEDTDDTGSGRPRDPEGVQKAGGAREARKRGDQGADGQGGNPATDSAK